MQNKNVYSMYHFICWRGSFGVRFQHEPANEPVVSVSWWMQVIS